VSGAIFVHSWPYVVYNLDPPPLFAMVVVAVLAAAAANITVPCGIIVAGVAALPCAMVVVLAVHVDSL
jgi:hypothetical protein